MTDRILDEEIKNWHPAPTPENINMKGRYVSLEPLSAEYHAKELFNAFSADKENKIWDYLPYGPFENSDDFAEWINKSTVAKDPYFLAIKKLENNLTCGVASYLRIFPEIGSIEVGHINYSPMLQNTIAATEVMYLMMKWAFENGYRRYEWKCNALNIKSRKAAQRLGFSFEGIFRQATIVKGRNRDTAWFSIIDKEWDSLEKHFKRWLAADNFDADGKQKLSLSVLTKPELKAIDPLFV